MAWSASEHRVSPEDGLAQARARGGAQGHWLLWVSAAAAVVIGGVAFVLWGTRGGSYLFDLIATYCF